MINVTIARDLQGLPRGFAHVEFSNELEAQNALLLSGGGGSQVGQPYFSRHHRPVCNRGSFTPESNET